MIRRPPRSTLFPTRRSSDLERPDLLECERVVCQHPALITVIASVRTEAGVDGAIHEQQTGAVHLVQILECRSEEHTSELQSLAYLVCRLLLEKKKLRIFAPM